MSKTIQDYIKEDRHLPEFLKDFHDQKDFFKLLFEWQSKSGMQGTEAHTWVSQHIFTIDVFLKFLALHGYRIERIRSPKMASYDLNDGIKKMRDEMFEQFKKMLEGRK